MINNHLAQVKAAAQQSLPGMEAMHLSIVTLLHSPLGPAPCCNLFHRAAGQGKDKYFHSLYRKRQGEASYKNSE